MHEFPAVQIPRMDQERREKIKGAVHVIGGGLAGSEAAFYLLNKGYEVHLHECRPLRDDGAHHTELFGELVCSNSLKSKNLDNAAGLLKEEMRKMNSITMMAAAKSEVPSGNALSVDRDLFAKEITAKLLSFPSFHLHTEEIKFLSDEPTILATGPLTSSDLLSFLQEKIGAKCLSFFDASAPIVSKDSIDFSKAYFKSRFDQDDAAYINCPFTKEEYTSFVTELLKAEKALVHEFDTQYFEGCLPVEVIASRGFETLRHGPLRPFGLSTDEHPRPYAVVQLRQDTLLGDYYNLVGFQTNLTYGEQRRVFSMIPGLEKAEFLRYGLMHRNSFFDSPRVLNEDLSLKAIPNVYVAGQLSGVEGYVESAAMGIVAGINLDRRLQGKPFLPVPRESVLGSLIFYILHAASPFTPMNANWGIVPHSDKHHRDVSIDAALSAIKSYWETANE